MSLLADLLIESSRTNLPSSSSSPTSSWVISGDFLSQFSLSTPADCVWGNSLATSDSLDARLLASNFRLAGLSTPALPPPETPGDLCLSEVFFLEDGLVVTSPPSLDCWYCPLGACPPTLGFESLALRVRPLCLPVLATPTVECPPFDCPGGSPSKPVLCCRLEFLERTDELGSPEEESFTLADRRLPCLLPEGGVKDAEQFAEVEDVLSSLEEFLACLPSVISSPDAELLGREW